MFFFQTNPTFFFNFFFSTNFFSFFFQTNSNFFLVLLINFFPIPRFSFKPISIFLLSLFFMFSNSVFYRCSFELIPIFFLFKFFLFLTSVFFVCLSKWSQFFLLNLFFTFFFVFFVLSVGKVLSDERKRCYNHTGNGLSTVHLFFLSRRFFNLAINSHILRVVVMGKNLHCEFSRRLGSTQRIFFFYSLLIWAWEALRQYVRVKYRTTKSPRPMKTRFIVCLFYFILRLVLVYCSSSGSWAHPLKAGGEIQGFVRIRGIQHSLRSRGSCCCCCCYCWRQRWRALLFLVKRSLERNKSSKNTGVKIIFRYTFNKHYFLFNVSLWWQFKKNTLNSILVDCTLLYPNLQVNLSAYRIFEVKLLIYSDIYYLWLIYYLFMIFTFSSHTEYVKKESIVIAWVMKQNSLLLTNFHDLYVLEDKTSQKKISVCLSVCLAVRTYVDFSCGHNNFRMS